MRYETPMIDFLLLEDDVVMTSGLEINPGGEVDDNIDWGDISNW